MRKGFTILVALLLIGAATTVGAQQADMGNGLSVQLGFYMPKDSEVKDVVGSNWLSLGLNYRVAATETVEHLVSLGYIRASGKTTDLGSTYIPGYGNVDISMEVKGSLIPLTYTYKTRPSADQKFYFGGGGGLYFSKTTLTATGGGVSESVDTTDTKPAIHILAGVNLSDKFMAEVRYTHFLSKSKIIEYQGESADADLSGLSFSLGASF